MKKSTWIILIVITALITLTTFSIGYKIGYSIFDGFVPKYEKIESY